MGYKNVKIIKKWLCISSYILLSQYEAVFIITNNQLK